MSTNFDPMCGDKEINKSGGIQASSPYMFRGLPPLAVQRVARILKEGAVKYEADPAGDMTIRNWMLISSDEHLEHILAHCIAYLNGAEITEDDAGNLATRALFFLHMRLVEQGEKHG